MVSLLLHTNFSMGSSRRSSETSLEDIQSRASVSLSLEYDDYPLDLVSPVNKDLGDPDFDLNGINIDDPGFISSLLNGSSDDPYVSSLFKRRRNTPDLPLTSSLLQDGDVPDDPGDKMSLLQGVWSPLDTVTKEIAEADRFYTDEVITDMGRRSLTDYFSRKDDDSGSSPVFVTPNPGPAAASAGLYQPSQCNGTYGPLAGEEDHYEKSVRCHCCRDCCRALTRPCLLRHHPLPEDPDWRDRCLHAIRCPPHGRLAHLAALAGCVLLAWAGLWALTGSSAFPGNPGFSLTVLTVAAYIAGKIVGKVKLPSLIGEYMK